MPTNDDLLTLLRTSYGWDVEPSAVPSDPGAFTNGDRT